MKCGVSQCSEEADTGRFVRLDNVEVITCDTTGVVAHWRNPNGELEEVLVNDWDFDPELLTAAIVPAEPGTFVLRDMYGDLAVKKSAVVAWLVSGQRAYPVTCTNQTTIDLQRKDRAVLFPDGHVELGGDGWSVEPRHFKTFADFSAAWPVIASEAKRKRADVRSEAQTKAPTVFASDDSDNVVHLPVQK